MTIEVFEMLGTRHRLSRAGTDTSLESRYWIRGTDDRDAAINALFANINLTPSVINGTEIVIPDSLEIEDVTDEQWEASITFVSPDAARISGPRQPKRIGEATFSFDGTGGTTTITQAYAQTKYGTAAPEHGNAINVVDGLAEGVEISVPALAFNIQQKFDGSTITLPWLRSIVLATGCVNQDTFLGFAPGEVLFMGPTGSQPFAFFSDGQVQFAEREMEFRFAVSPNLTGLTIDGISVPEKPGHDYLWRHRVRKVHPPSPAPVESITEKTLGVYVAQVYRRIPFSSLGISNPAVSFPVS
jgi:hypothetical protein